MKMRIVFKGGAVVDCDVISFETASDFGGQISRLQWKTPANPQVKLSDVNVDQVAAVYAIHDQEATA